MGVTIEIIFDNKSALFYPGQYVEGKVKINLISSKQSKGVVMIFKGKAKVSWSDGFDSDDDNTVSLHGEEEYYEREFYIWGRGHTQTLDEGQHLFPFAYKLPLNIPGSFESSIGRVKHECTAKLLLDRSLNRKKTVTISVCPTYDLNTDWLSDVPINESKDKMICCLCCKSGPISAMFNINQTGYVCGEFIRINAECINMSNREVSYSSVSVYQNVTYIGKLATKKMSKLVCEKRRPSIAPGETDCWVGVNLYIPPIPPSHLPDCSIINIQYEFWFVVNPFGAKSLTIKKPITIGTIPLQKNFKNIAVVHPKRFVQPVEPDDMCPIRPAILYSAIHLPHPSPYPDCPHPGYAESMYFSDASSVCSDSNDDEEGRANKPLYVSYSFV